MITGVQIRMARTALGWSAEYLAKMTGLSWGTIQRVEKAGGAPETMQAGNLNKIKTALEKAGIIFIEPGDYTGRGGVGVRMRK